MKTNKMSSAGAVFGFAAFLACMEKPVEFGKCKDAAPAAELAKLFCKANGLGEPGDSEMKKIVHPTLKGPCLKK